MEVLKRLGAAADDILRRTRAVMPESDRSAVVREPRSGPAGTAAFALYPLPSKGLLGVAGEHHHAQAVMATIRAGKRDAPPEADAYARDIVRKERDAVWIRAALIPDQDNRHDRNAIAVRSDLSLLGYIPREDAGDYQEVFRLLREYGYEGATIPAFVRKSNQQVILCLSTAYHCYRSVRDDLIVRRAWESLQAGEDPSEVARRFGWSGTGPLRRTVRRWARESNLPDPESEGALGGCWSVPSVPLPRRRAGWLPDPLRRARLRYWDGEAWSNRLANGTDEVEDPMPPPL
jgi:hypothetical protein